ncbi:MAG TPA: hypothetical protein VFD58_00515 [Blastocatellia bacterium]|nr:hypothetical protein [Blastocatellia bacterium]
MTEIAGSKLIFGIYPGSGTIPGAEGPGDDPEQISAALDLLQPASAPFLVRGYLQYVGSGTSENDTPADVTRYLRNGRQLDLALSYRTPDGDLDDWSRFIRSTIRHYGSSLAKIQIAEEPNNPDARTGGDGGSPNVRRAIVEGVVAAKDEAKRLNLTIKVGFNATVIFNPEDDFWPAIAALVTPSFFEALDYVGLDFFPDVFRPLPDDSLDTLRRAVEYVLRQFREENLPGGKIPASVPIHITENGWPTSPDRTEESQAAVIETIIRTIHAHRAGFNITHYEFFDLRDLNSSNPDIFHQFGLLRDDYSPKPAFESFRRLVAELSVT